MSETESEVTGEVEEEWQKAEVLEPRLDDGKTYEEIAEEFTDEEGVGPSEAQIGEWARRHGINRGREGARYQSDDVPLFHQQAYDEIGHAIPKHVLEEYDLEVGDFVRHVPKVTGRNVEFDLVFEDEELPVDGSWSHERALSDPSKYHLTDRYPRQLAAYTGLLNHAADGRESFSAGDGDDSGILLGSGSPDGEGEETDVQAIIDNRGEGNVTVRFAPALNPWSAADRGEQPESLEAKTKTLSPLSNTKLPDPKEVEKYRFMFPSSYAEHYGLQSGGRVVLRYGMIQGDEAIIVDFKTDPDTVHPRRVRRIQTVISGEWGSRSHTYGFADIAEENEEAIEEIKTDFREENGEEPSTYQVAQKALERNVGKSRNYLQPSYGFYPGKAVLHAHGIGLTESNPEVRLIPGDGYVALIP